MPVTGVYARFAYPGRSIYGAADLSPVLLLFCIVSLAGAALFSFALAQEGGRWWAAVPLAALLAALAAFGPVPQSSGISLFATVLLAPVALVLLLGALPVRQGTFAWFSVIEAGIISLFGMAWAYGLFLAPSLPANIRVDSPSLYEFAGAAYVYVGLPLLGIMLLALASQCSRQAR